MFHHYVIKLYEILSLMSFDVRLTTVINQMLYFIKTLFIKSVSQHLFRTFNNFNNIKNFYIQNVF